MRHERSGWGLMAPQEWTNNDRQRALGRKEEAFVLFKFKRAETATFGRSIAPLLCCPRALNSFVVCVSQGGSREVVPSIIKAPPSLSPSSKPKSSYINPFHPSLPPSFSASSPPTRPPRSFPRNSVCCTGDSLSTVTRPLRGQALGSP